MIWTEITKHKCVRQKERKKKKSVEIGLFLISKAQLSDFFLCIDHNNHTDSIG